MRKRRGIGPLVVATLPVLLFLGLTAFLFLNPGLLGSLQLSPDTVRRASSRIVDALNQGQTQQADGMFADIAAHLNSVGEVDPYVGLAKELIRLGRPTDAVRYLSEATHQAGPGTVSWDPMLWQTLADAQDKAGDRDQAARSRTEAGHRADVIRQTVGMRPPDGTAAQEDRVRQLIEVGGYYSDVVDDLPAALAVLQEAVRIVPDRSSTAPLAMNALGYTLADKGFSSQQFDQAVDLTRKAMDLEPDNPVIQNSYGWALFKKNDLIGARRVLRAAVDADPDESELHYHLGVVYGQLGLTSDARLEIDRALTIDPDLKDAKDALKRLRLPAGQGVLESA